MDSLLYLIAILSGGLFGFFTVLVVDTINDSVPSENREYMDPLPFGLKMIWPLIRIISFYGTSKLSEEYLHKLETRLHHTGVAYLLQPSQFVALRIISSVLVFVGTAFCLMLLGEMNILWGLLAFIGGYFFPDVWLRDTRLKREGMIIRQLPVYLDFITMSVEAGLNLTGALNQAREKGPSGPMRNEFGIVLRDIRSGSGRSEALRRMANRLNITEITSFVSAIIQADRMGASLGQTLRAQADQRRGERFQRAEKQAMEAPVKLVGPLVLFIFPVTFIVLGFPLVMKFMAQGIL